MTRYLNHGYGKIRRLRDRNRRNDPKLEPCGWSQTVQITTCKLPTRARKIVLLLNDNNWVKLPCNQWNSADRKVIIIIIHRKTMFVYFVLLRGYEKILKRVKRRNTVRFDLKWQTQKKKEKNDRNISTNKKQKNCLRNYRHEKLL